MISLRQVPHISIAHLPQSWASNVTPYITSLFNSASKGDLSYSSSLLSIVLGSARLSSVCAHDGPQLFWARDLPRYRKGIVAFKRERAPIEVGCCHSSESSVA